MKIIYVDSIEFETDEEQVVKILEGIAMETNQTILIRNKKDALKVSKQTIEVSERMRRDRYRDALANNDHLYLSSVYETLSSRNLVKLLLKKYGNIFKDI